jgi:hypothetical protein
VLWFFTALLFAGLWLVVASRDGARLDRDAPAFVLFLGLLPLLNAWADFASTGLTRWRLRKGVQGNLVGNAVLDAVAAVAILLALALAIVATVHFLRTGDGAPLFDLAAFFADLRADPGAYWWLGFMLFSTLLPTVAHLAIGSFALFTLISGRLGKPIAAGLLKGDSPEGRFATLALTLATALAAWLPFFILYHVIAYGGGWLLAGLLDIVEGFHRFLATTFPW